MVLRPGNSYDERFFDGNQLGLARLRIPFTGNVSAETLSVKILAERRYGILIGAVPIFTKIVPFQELFQSLDPFSFHTTSGISHFQSGNSSAGVSARSK